MYKTFPLDSAEIGKREAKWLTTMGTHVCPAVIGCTETGYVMEELAPLPVGKRAYLPLAALLLLRDRVWSEAALWEPGAWVQRIDEIFGAQVPDFIVMSADINPSCCHGDPSFSNIMMGRDSIRLIDPCHRDYTPETWGVDTGKIIQSCLGWEMLQAGWDPVDYILPTEEPFHEGGGLRVTLWWAGMHALRISRREGSAQRRPEVLEWAEMVRTECWRAVGL